MSFCIKRVDLTRDIAMIGEVVCLLSARASQKIDRAQASTEEDDGTPLAIDTLMSLQGALVISTST